MVNWFGAAGFQLAGYIKTMLDQRVFGLADFCAVEPIGGQAIDAMKAELDAMTGSALRSGELALVPPFVELVWPQFGDVFAV